MFTLYILYSQKLNKFYIGQTADMEKRLVEHNTGVSNFTSKSNDWLLKSSETFNTRDEALKREKVIKAKKSRKYIEWLISSTG